MAIRNCIGSSIVSDVENMVADNKKAFLELRYGRLPDPGNGRQMWGAAKCASVGGGVLVRITIDRNQLGSDEPDRWARLAKVLLHEYYHAMDMLTHPEGCDAAMAAGENRAEERALDAYKQIFGRRGPGAKGYRPKIHGTAPPPCRRQ